MVSFDRIPDGLGVGEMTEVTLHTGSAQTGLVVPNTAIKPMPEGAGVWRLTDGKPQLAPVRLGSTSLDGAVLVMAGLAEGDEVVVHSERELAEGARVKVVGQLVGAPR